MIRPNSKRRNGVGVIMYSNLSTLTEPDAGTDYGLTRKFFAGINSLSSRSALAGFSCSKPPLNPIKQASSKFVEAFL